jgi:outer membrane autotransporter protein
VVASQQVTLDARAQFGSTVLSGVDSMAFCDQTRRNVSRPDCRIDGRAWGSATYRQGDHDGNLNTATTRQIISSLAAGYEKRVSPNALLGAAIDVNHLTFSVPERWTSGTVDGATAAAYGMAWSDLGFYGKALLTAGAYRNEMNRVALGRRVSGDYRAYGVGSTLEVGYRQQINSFSVTPFAAFRLDTLIQPGWSEENAIYGNHYDREQVNSRVLVSGLRIESAVNLGANAWINTFAHAAYSRELNADRGLTGYSLAAPGFRWDVEGLAAPPESVQLDLGLKSRIGESLDLTIKGTYIGYSGGSQTSGSLSLSYRF